MVTLKQGDKVKQKHDYFTHFFHQWGIMSVKYKINKSNKFVLCKEGIIQDIPFSHSYLLSWELSLDHVEAKL